VKRTGNNQPADVMAPLGQNVVALKKSNIRQDTDTIEEIRRRFLETGRREKVITQ
jgi:hypothetical protein